MREEVRFHQKVVGSLNLGCLPTYLSQVFFLEGVQSIVNRGSNNLKSKISSVVEKYILHKFSRLSKKHK